MIKPTTACAQTMALGGMLALFSATIGCRKESVPQSAFSVPVTAAEVLVQNTTNYLEFIGQTLGGQDVEIRARVPGFLEDYVEDGFVRRADGSLTLRCKPAWESATFSAHRHDLVAALRALKVPARILVADQMSTSASTLDVIRANAPAMVIEPVPGSTHFIPMESPDLVLARMLALIDNG